MTNRGLPAGHQIEIPVIVELVRINPSFIVVKHIEMKIDSVWQEKTAIRFVMDDKKNIIRFKSDFVSIISGSKRP